MISTIKLMNTLTLPMVTVLYQVVRDRNPFCCISSTLYSIIYCSQHTVDQILYFIFYQIFSSFTFQMLSQKPSIASPHSAPQHTHSHFLALALPYTGAQNLCKTKGLSPIDGRLGHPLLHRQLETGALGVLASSYCCSSYGAADSFSSLGTFSSFFIGDSVFHSIDDCEHPLFFCCCF